MKKISFVVYLIISAVSLFAQPTDETSKAFTYVAKKATPGVVYIKTELGSSSSLAPNNQDPFYNFHDEFFRRFFGSPDNLQQPKMGGGSGFFISKDGYIVTNNHVVKDANKITVALNNGDEYEASIVGTDSRIDLAVIKIDIKNAPYLTFGNSDVLEVGEWVLAIGSPFSYQASVTAGIVSAKGRQDLKIADLEDFIQTDAAINPGNSGGPLLNMQAEVIGINTAIAITSQGGGYIGICFAIPSNMSKNAIDQIIACGAVKRGYLGVTLQDMDKNTQEAFGLENVHGIVITDVTANSPAEKANLKAGDIILALNNASIKNMTSFRKDIATFSPNTTIKLTIRRDNKKFDVSVMLGEYPEQTICLGKSLELGIEVSNIKDVPSEQLLKLGYNQNIEAVMITSVKRGSFADKAGMVPGMLILQINQKKVKNLEDFNLLMNAAATKKHILFLIKNKNQSQFITIKFN